MENTVKKENLDQEIQNSFIVNETEICEEDYPRLDHFSTAYFYDFTPIPAEKKSPEYVYYRINQNKSGTDDKLFVFVAQWNWLWEAGHLRYDFFADTEKIPKELEWLKRYKEHNIYLLPQNYSHKYYTHSPLFHLLPKKVLKYFGLPLFKKGAWPYTTPFLNDQLFPADFNNRLSKAFSYHIWPLICSGSPISAFSKTESIRVLAHNLDFWLPYICKLIESKIRDFSRVEFEDAKQQRELSKLRKKLPSNIKAERPYRGGDIWWGEDEAWKATKAMVELADSEGQLRSIIDAVKSNRMKDDFSDRWSYAKEDFERKLYQKRSKVKVSFVELNNTIPVHGPESEVHENLLWEDFIALMDTKEKHIVICLRNGITKVGEISKILGYANHSPVSKALKKIRKKAEHFLEI
jgi:hypothetical protein